MVVAVPGLGHATITTRAINQRTSNPATAVARAWNTHTHRPATYHLPLWHIWCQQTRILSRRRKIVAIFKQPVRDPRFKPWVSPGNTRDDIIFMLKKQRITLGSFDMQLEILTKNNLETAMWYGNHSSFERSKKKTSPGTAEPFFSSADFFVFHKSIVPTCGALFYDAFIDRRCVARKCNWATELRSCSYGVNDALHIGKTRPPFQPLTLFGSPFLFCMMQKRK